MSTENNPKTAGAPREMKMSGSIMVEHPEHLVAAIGTESDLCFMAPTTRAPRGLTYVWEPRRDCHYWIETPVKKWRWQ